MNTLPDLEKTVIEIIVELLLADKEHRFPDLIYGHPERHESVRSTMHYVMALLAYGFAPDEPELVKAADWFDTEFPKQRFDTIDTIEMNRLNVLLRLRPGQPGVQTRLEQLVRQQANGHFDVQPGWGEFDSLWAIEMFTLAHEAEVLPQSIMTLEDIKRHLDKLLIRRELRRDKDFALALNLQFRLFGKLEDTHVEVLDEILTMTEQSGGLWGMREFRWQLDSLPWYQDLLQGRILTYEDVEENANRFRKVVLSTCMVVEYLSPLMDVYPPIRETLEKALSLWWGQFNGPTPVAMLRGLFSKAHDYDYLLVLTRTLRAVREFIGHPLRNLNTVYLLRELTNLKTNTAESTEIINIKEALRNWMQFDLAEPPERLRLGFSDSNVVRVRPHIWSPLSSNEERPTSVIQHSLIIKYGPTEDVNKERENYERLPAATRDYFVRIPEATYMDRDNGISYVIMQDLRDYKTLYEIYDIVAQNAREVADQLGNFLIRMHEGGSSQLHPAARSTFRELYLGKFLEYVDRVFNFLVKHSPVDRRSDLRDAQDNMFEFIAEIIQHQRRLEVFPQAYMHGDLHLRNIMVTGLWDTRFGNGGSGGNSNRGMIFKLIDLEFMRQDGDIAFDAGQLVVDLELASREARALNHQRDLQKLRDNIERTYRQFAATREDGTFGVRLELAKARALMRIAKGKTKRGQKYHESNNIPLLHLLCEELINDVREATQYLQAVISAVRAYSSGEG